MKNHTHNYKYPRQRMYSRRGGMLVMMAFLMMSCLIVGMMAVNVAYLEMAKTDLKTATDLAARSSMVTLGTSQNTGQSRKTLRDEINANVSADPAMNMKYIGVTWGEAEENASGRYEFVPVNGQNGAKKNALLVTSRYPAIFSGNNLPFSYLTMAGNIEVQSTVSRSDVDIVLAIDRSGSMAWDLSNVPYRYPNGTKTLDNYFKPPDPDNSRWAALIRAVSNFIGMIENNELPGNIHLGLVTFSSNYTFGLHESNRVTVDVPMTSNVQEVVDALNLIGTKPLLGDTNIHASLQKANNCRVTGDYRRITGQKIIILLTDGNHTEGQHPRIRAASLANQKWIIHTISFSDQADQHSMAEVAEIGDGMHLHAPSEEALTAAFEEIGRSLPGILID